MESENEVDPLLGTSGISAVTTVVPTTRHRSKQYKSYTQRWFMLMVLSLLNFSNGMIWITFSSIADITAEYYNVGANGVNWLAVVFMVVCIPLGFFAIWALDTRGLKKVIHTAAWLNLFGAGVRLLSVFNTISIEFKYPMLLSGQCIAAYAQPFLMFATTKMAALWFPEEQRAIANTVSSMANPVGILAANVLSPIIVKNKDLLFWMLEATTVPAALGTFFTYLIVTRDTPPTPPSASAEQQSESFVQGIKQVVKNKNYWLLCYSFGAGMALFTTVFTLLEQILCSAGYSDEFSGLCVGLLIVLGFVGAAIAGYIVDKTKKFEEVAKVCYCIAAICLVGFALACTHSHITVVMAIIIACVGFFGFAIYPVCLELSVECTFPVAEATSSGLLIISGQIQSALYIVIIQLSARPYSGHSSTCHADGPAGVTPQDYTVSTLVFAGLAVLSSLTLLLFFKCDYKRLNAERAQLSDWLVSRRGVVNDGDGDDHRPLLSYT